MKTVLLIGQHGQVSTYLQEELPKIAHLVVLGREQIDLARPESIKPAIQNNRADLIINPAAYTAVDAAETDQQQAFAINCDAVGELANCAKSVAIPVLHFSTDYVFDGEAESPYVETDSPNPTGVYGASKLAGEQAALDSGADVLVLRTSWVYSNQGKNFYRTMLKLAETRDQLSVVEDQRGSPTFAGSIANATRELTQQLLANPGLAEKHRGVYHFSCQGQTSWHGFAEAIFAAHGKRNIKVSAISTAAFPTPARRPAYSVLSNAKLKATFQVELPHWSQGLADCVAESPTS